MTVTPLYASILALLFIFLSFRVIRVRRAAKVSLGDGGDRDLLRRQRAHGNFAEYVPLTLVLLLTGELQGAPIWALHAVGLALLIGRVLHAYGINQEPKIIRWRVNGMLLTFAALAGAALLNLGMSVTKLLT